MRDGAEITPCEQYRYWLTRAAKNPAPGNDPTVFIMLNPSTADASENDATIRRCMGFSETWGNDGLIVVNLYGLRSTSPKVLKKHPAPVGPDNDAHLRAVLENYKKIICAWGDGADFHRVMDFKRMARDFPYTELYSIGNTTKKGNPRHPLYLKADSKLVPWGVSSPATKLLMRPWV